MHNLVKNNFFIVLSVNNAVLEERMNFSIFFVADDNHTIVSSIGRAVDLG